jgi:hypothetical protein
VRRQAVAVDPRPVSDHVLGVMEDIPLTEHRYIKRREAERFWQFQFEREPFKESKTFYDKDFGSREASLLAARDHRDAFFRAAAELGFVGPDGSVHIDPIPIQLAISPRNKSGIIGVSREVTAGRPKRSPQKTWIANFKSEAGQHDQKSFSIKALGEKQALLAALQHRRSYVARVLSGIKVPAHQDLVRKHLDDLDFLHEYIESLVQDAEIFTLLATLNNPLLSPTEKHDFLARRIGQEKFRRAVLARWEDKCVVTGAMTFLTAGHIKPWSESTDLERLDPANGLALSPVYDKAFDAGLISFAESGVIIISARLALDAHRLGITGQEKIQGLTDSNHKYLEYHRSIKFRV